jgi:hypothetical protein
LKGSKGRLEFGHWMTAPGGFCWKTLIFGSITIGEAMRRTEKFGVGAGLQSQSPAGELRSLGMRSFDLELGERNDRANFRRAASVFHHNRRIPSASGLIRKVG